MIMDGGKEQLNFSPGQFNRGTQSNQTASNIYGGHIQGAPSQQWIFSPRNVPPPPMTPEMRTPLLPPNVGTTPSQQHRPPMDGFHTPRDPRQQRYPAVPFQPHGGSPQNFDRPPFGSAGQRPWPLAAPVQPPIMMPPTQWGIPPPPLNFPGMPHPSSTMPPLLSPSVPPMFRPLNFGLPGTPSWSKGSTAVVFPPAPSPRGIAERMGLSSDGGVHVSESHDDPFISDWLRIVGSKREQQQRQEEESERQQHRIKIVEARQLLGRASVLLSLLNSAHQQLSALSSDDVVNWREITSQVTRHKEELLAIRGRLDSGDGLEQLVKKINKRKKRRASMKLHLKEKKAVKQERRAKAEAATEKWLHDKRQAELKAKTEKSVQTAASGVLNEVKRKQSELEKYLKLLPALQKLRDFRRETLKRKGESPSIEADEKFSESFESLQDLLTRQSRVYEDEERALRVLMEEEVEEKMSSQQRRDKSRDDKTAVTVSHMLDPPSQAAVATTSDGSIDSVMEPFRQYYHQAEQSEECLTAVRSQWDHFLSPHGAPISCNLDNSTPSPSSNEWSKFIIHPVQ